MALKGRLSVVESSARVDADLPFAAFPFMGKIEADARVRMAVILT
jgi:hypothetical protein